MAGFLNKTGKTKFMYFPKTASVTMAKGDLLYPDGSGRFQLADSTSGEHIGVLQKDIASTDSDYADNTLKPVEIPLEFGTEWEIETSSAVAGDVLLEIDLTDENTANRGASSKDALRVTKFISATVIWVVILSSAWHKYTATT